MQDDIMDDIRINLAHHRENAFLNSPTQEGLEFVFSLGEVPEKQYGGKYIRGIWLALADYRESPSYFEISFRTDAPHRPLTSIHQTEATSPYFIRGMDAEFFDKYGSLIEQRIQICNPEAEGHLEPFRRELAYQRACKGEGTRTGDGYSKLVIRIEDLKKLQRISTFRDR